MNCNWLEMFEDPVVNDKMICDTSKTEHSYSSDKTNPTPRPTLDEHTGPSINPVRPVAGFPTSHPVLGLAVYSPRLHYGNVPPKIYPDKAM